MPGYDPVASLRDKLKEKDLEVHSLNQVLLRQGRQLQNTSHAAVEEALKRKEGLVRAHQARADKLEMQNAALREELQREEHRRRKAEEECHQKQEELHAYVEMHGGRDLGSERLIDEDTVTIVETREKLHESEERCDALTAELNKMRQKLADSEASTRALEEEKEEALKQAEAAKLRPGEDGRNSSGQSDVQPPEEPHRGQSRPGPKLTEGQLAASLPAEAYRAMQGQVRILPETREPKFAPQTATRLFANLTVCPCLGAYPHMCTAS